MTRRDLYGLGALVLAAPIFFGLGQYKGHESLPFAVVFLVAYAVLSVPWLVSSWLFTTLGADGDSTVADAASRVIAIAFPALLVGVVLAVVTTVGLPRRGRADLALRAFGYSAVTAVVLMLFWMNARHAFDGNTWGKM